jgi:hypothetical protein
MKRIIGVCVLLLLIASVAFAASANERRFICVGMSEGEVLQKIGKPDSESIDSGGAAMETVKRWIYLPAEGDPQTITTVVLKNGQVFQITREISR